MFLKFSIATGSRAHRRARAGVSSKVSCADEPSCNRKRTGRADRLPLFTGAWFVLSLRPSAGLLLVYVVCLPHPPPGAASPPFPEAIHSLSALPLPLSLPPPLPLSFLPLRLPPTLPSPWPGRFICSWLTFLLSRYC